MRKPTLYAVRFFMIVVGLAALSLILAPPSNQGSPYLSALAAISAPPATAQTCAMTSCGRDKEGGFICTSSGTSTNCNRNKSGNRCSTTNC